MYFDIRDENNAVQTLANLTGVDSKFWIAEKIKNQDRTDYKDEYKDIERVIMDNNGHFPKLKDIEIIITHITTSNDNCSSIKEKGLLNLKESYKIEGSDLRKFLDENGVYIDIDSRTLNYREKVFDISYGECPENNESSEYKSWSVGRKLYFDFAVCGFLTIDKRDIYGGLVHKRPEFLNDIDYLLGTNLSAKWFESHSPYEVVFVVPAYKVIYGGWNENADEHERVLYYLSCAYESMNSKINTKEIICKDDTEVLPEDIIEINVFDKW